MVLIGGLVKTSLNDYPAMIACTVFTAGCNFLCGYCQNPQLVDLDPKDLETISEKSFLDFLVKRKNQLDGVCISGGEPTIQTDLADFIRKLKKLGYKVKLDTNGTCPETLESLFAEKLVDFVAMDIKGSIDNYEKVANVFVNKQDILKSIKIIKQKAPDYEFRSTILPYFHDEKEIHKMGKLIAGSKLWVLQNFKPSAKLLQPAFADYPVFTSKEFKKFQAIGRKYAKKCEIRD